MAPKATGWWEASRCLRGLAWLAVIACLYPAVPVSAQLFGGGDDVARKQIAEQSKRLEELKRQNEDLAARLAVIDESIKGLTASNPAIDLAQQLERIRQEVTQMRGQIEVVGNDIQMASKRQRDMYVDLDTRMKRLEESAAARYEQRVSERIERGIIFRRYLIVLFDSNTQQRCK